MKLKCATTESRITPLMIAARRADVAGMNLLLNNRANINERGICGWTPLFYAIENGSFTAVNFLIEHGADFSQKVLTNSDNPYELPSETALNFASYQGCAKIIRLLLKKHVNINEQNNDGLAPLHFAAYNSSMESVKLLIENGADVNIKDRMGATPLIYASINGTADVATYLIEHGANMSAKAILRSVGIRSSFTVAQTPLSTATIAGNDEVLRVLVEHGVDVD